MPERLTAVEVLDREFLEIRCRLIDIAASMDRLHRADASSSLSSDPRMGQLHRALVSLTEGNSGHAERMQMVFSDGYDPNWRDG